MRRRTKFILGSVFLLIVLGTGAYWQMSKLTTGLRTMPMDTTTELLVGTLSNQVLAPGVDGAVSLSSEQEPLLDQYRKNPDLARLRYRLVITWMHASQIFKAIGHNPPSEGKMISSVSISSVPLEERVDGWGRPYCILADARNLTLLSGGGNDALNCDALQETAEQAAARATDSRLTKDGRVLVVVYKRGDNLPTAHRQ